MIYGLNRNICIEYFMATEKNIFITCSPFLLFGCLYYNNLSETNSSWYKTLINEKRLGKHADCSVVDYAVSAAEKSGKVNIVMAASLLCLLPLLFSLYYFLM